jgi:hypothetical protein
MPQPSTSPVIAFSGALLSQEWMMGRRPCSSASGSSSSLTGAVVGRATQ